MPSDKRLFGDEGEDYACKYLASKGYEILDRNYLRRWGEIDIVSRSKERIIFFEVKTRDSRSTMTFLPETSISKRKASRLRNICETYLAERRVPDGTEWQIDLIYISNDAHSGAMAITHFENIVWGKGY